MIYKEDMLTVEEMKNEIAISFRVLDSMKKLVEFKQETNKQKKIDAIYKMLESKKQEMEKTVSIKKIQAFHKNYILRFKTNEKSQTLIRLDIEKLINDSNFDFNSSVAYTIFMHTCSKNRIEITFLLSDLKHIDKGIAIEDIEVDKKYTFIRDVDYKNFKFKEKSIIAFTGKTDISGNKEILVNGLIYIKDTQGISYITSKSFFLTNLVSAKIFEIEEN